MKRRLSEEVGVPQGIIDAGKILYYYVVKQIKSKGLDEPISENSDKTFTFKSNIHILDFNIVKVRMSIQFMTHGGVDDIMLIQAGFSSKSRQDYGKFLFISDNQVGFSEFKIKFVVPENKEITTEDIINYIENNETKMTSTLSHELKHAYDDFVKGFESMSDRADYASITSFHGFGLESIRNFFHLLYLGTNAEILVKPTEVASRMNSNEINKLSFLEFLLNDETYREFKQMSELTYGGFVHDEILQDKKNIVNLFTRSNINIPNSDSELINQLFHFLYVEYSSNKIEILNDILTENIRESFFGFTIPEKVEYFERKVKEFSKYEKNPSEFFKNRIKYLNFVGEKMMKKLGKLYSIAKDDTKKSDIINKIYNKVNNG